MGCETTALCLFADDRSGYNEKGKLGVVGMLFNFSKQLAFIFTLFFLIACSGGEVASPGLQGISGGNGVGEIAPPSGGGTLQNQAGPEERPGAIADVIPEEPCTIQLLQYRMGSRFFDSLSEECQERQRQWEAYCREHAVDPASCEVTPRARVIDGLENPPLALDELTDILQNRAKVIPVIPLTLD